MDPLLLLRLLVVALLSLHGAHRAALLWTWWRTRGPAPAPPPLPDLPPRVLVQLPVYNERDVVERLVDAVAALDWPADRLSIQLLDDATDDTGDRAEPALARARARGIRAERVRRGSREGFKAGALAAGLTRDDAELVAIFDADFVPPADLLRALVPELLRPGVGMVQARWGHHNDGESSLTRAQAALLDGHFVIEHAARHRGGAWFNFNGTAGIWRRACIEDAGGWRGDTLTEDLDLSYRAQLAGWRFVYRPDVVVPAELPASMLAFRAQQRRWAKGSIQTLRLLAAAVARSSAPLRVRAHALAHLGANLGWPLAVGLAVLLPLTALAPALAPGLGRAPLWFDVGAFTLSTGVSALFYRAATGGWARVPLAMALAVGLSVSQARATLDGLWGRASAFVRTPKSGGAGTSYLPARDLPREERGWGSLPAELALAALNLAAAGLAAGREAWGPMLFLGLFGVGYGWVAVAGLRERWWSPAAAGAPAEPALNPVPGT